MAAPDLAQQAPSGSKPLASGRDVARKATKLTAKRRAALSIVERADIATIDALAPVLRSRPGRMLGEIGTIADGPPLLALSAAVLGLGLALRRPRLARTGARTLSAALLAISLKEFGKDNVDRSRPKALLKKRRYLMDWGTSRRAALRAFPSGHTAGAIAVAAAASREYPIAIPAHSAAVTLGALQILRQAHYPSDVAAGVALGLIAEGISTALFAAFSR